MDDSTKPIPATLAYRVDADYYCTKCGIPASIPQTIDTPCGKVAIAKPRYVVRVIDETDLYDGGLGGDHSELAVQYRHCRTCGESLEPRR